MNAHRPQPSVSSCPLLSPLWSVSLAFFLALTAAPLLAARPAPAGPSTAAAREAAWERHQALVASSPFHGLPWRCVGPVVQGGRVVDIESAPGAPYTFYVAYASGGLWRTTNNGVTFEALSDDEPTMIMGDVAVDPQRPETLWVGTGEANSSRSSYGGMGVYRSDDRGTTWRHAGLAESDRIGRVLVDPRDSDRVYVAALGKLYTSGGQRGIYRTLDGGTTWEQVLAGDEVTGFVDLVQDASHPDTLYAAAWQRTRRPWDFVEGGPGSGIWKSTDGGTTWQRLGGGLPQGEHVGRIGLAIAASQPQTIYAAIDNQELLPEELWDLGNGAITAKRLRSMTKEEFLSQDPDEIESFIRGNDLDTSLDAKTLVTMIENDELTLEELRHELDDANANLFETDIKGLEIWRSDDGGASWQRTHEEPLRDVVYTYGYYFGQIRVAPDDPQRIYTVGVPLITSTDGGATFSSAQGRDVHGDYHGMWLDPLNPQRMIVGNDGGVDVSYDGGASWLKLDAQPVGQFYAITVDMADPYNIYGGLQDNGVLMGSSQTRWELGPSWRTIGGGDGMQVQVDPRDRTVYWGFQFGFYFRNDPNGERSATRPRDALEEPALRYNWQSPIQLSEHNPDILYFGSDRLFRSLDKGETWTAISPVLSRSEKRGDVPFATLTTIVESPLTFGLLWVGTDDGYVHVSEDGGVEWREATAGLPADRWVSRVEASHHQRQVAYVSLNGYRDDDITPYLYRTADLGKTWTSIAGGLPAEAINVVREDPVNEDVLYVGTDRSVYVSLDRGGSWQALQAALPNVPVHDLVVHPRERELVAGTHGRSVWVVDVLPVQELAEAREEAVHVFPVEEVPFQRWWRSRRPLWPEIPHFDPSVEIPFWTAADGTAVLTVRDGDERVLRRLELAAGEGINTFSWDLLLDEELALAAEEAALAAEEDANGEEAEKEADSTQGQRAKTPWAEAVRLGRQLYITPGTYSLRVEVGEDSGETTFEVKPPEPREPRMKPKPKIRGEKGND